MSKPESFPIRDITEQDVGFVVSSWRSSFRNSYYAGVIPMNRYNDIYRDVIEGVLLRPGIKVYIAGTEQDIFGYIVTEPSEDPIVVHWCYVKQAYRKMGCARALFSKCGITPYSKFVYTFKTLEAADAIRAKGLSAKFDPVLARYPKKEDKRHESSSRRFQGTRPSP